MEQKNICDTQSCCSDVESGNKTSLIGKNLVYCKDFYCLNCGFCFTVSKSTTGYTPKKVYILVVFLLSENSMSFGVK